MNINPLKLILLLMLLSNDNKHSRPDYFDTFKLDLLLDKLHHTVNALENVNRLRQFSTEPPTLPDSNTETSPASEAVPDMNKLMESFGPMINMMMNQR